MAVVCPKRMAGRGAEKGETEEGGRDEVRRNKKWFRFSFKLNAISRDDATELRQVDSSGNEDDSIQGMTRGQLR